MWLVYDKINPMIDDNEPVIRIKIKKFQWFRWIELKLFFYNKGDELTL